VENSGETGRRHQRALVPWSLMMMMIRDISALEVLSFHVIALYKSTLTYLLTLLTYSRWLALRVLRAVA